MPTARQLVFHTVNQAQRARRLVPPSIIPRLVERRIEKLWQDEAYRIDQEQQMHHLLSATDRADEIPEIARGFAAWALLRTYMRWHPRAITNQEIRGIEHLTTGRDMSRPVLMSFTHHGLFTGMFTPLVRGGVPLEVVLAPIGLRYYEPIIFRQHRRVASRHVVVIDSTTGVDGIAAHLVPGAVVAIAPDVPGQTEVTFLGKRLRGSFGTPRLSMMTNAPIVVVTAHRGESWEPYVQVHPPIDPNDYTDPHDLLAEVLRIHGEAWLEWPESVEMPYSRFAALDEPATAQGPAGSST